VWRYDNAIPERKPVAKKLRIGVFYNQPVSGGLDARKYVTATGKLMNANGIRSHARVHGNGQGQTIDLSEFGVLEEMDDIRNALNNIGYRATTLNVDSDIFRLIDHLREEKPDLIFNLVECIENEADQEMHVAGIYELLKVPYTGASAFTLGLALNKPKVKEILSYHGIRTPRYQVFTAKDKIEPDAKLTYPLIVKPSREDASVGISDESVVYNLSELKKQVRYVHSEFEQPALAEQYIEGREVNVAILGNQKPVALPISEIDFSGLSQGMHKIVSYDAKWMEGTVAFKGTQGVCPASLEDHEEALLKDIALRCYRIIGCRDYARVDIRLTKNGTPYVLEVNPNPDISDDAGFARSAKAYGLTFDQVVARIVEIALERYR
jgi:D-alanine-D-alanine ligase